MLPELDSSPAAARILIVEDDVLIRAIVADELRSAGFSVVEAASADEALSYLKAGGQTDLVFSDIWMPGSLNGLDLARQLRDKYPSLPIILASGNFSSQNLVDFGLFLRKPYDVEHAVAMVSEALGFEPRAVVR
jgi:CheY-like chemotaxis protein